MLNSKNKQEGNQKVATDGSSQDSVSGSSSLLPSISLPKGGGAIRGIDAKFSANPVTGTGSMTVFIATSPGRAGFGPQLSLSYDSGAGNGPFGFGWSLSLPSITRKTEKGLPRYDDVEESDGFILSGNEDLVPLLVEEDGQWRRKHEDRTLDDGVTYSIFSYRPRIEGLFARIERWTNQRTGQIHWRSLTKDNITTLYGERGNSSIADPEDTSRIFSWLICESYDDKGNVITYEYKAEDSANVDLSQAQERNRTELTRSANRYIKRIRYGNRTPRQADEDFSRIADMYFEIVFDYGEHDLAAPTPQENMPWPARPDAFSTYRAGFEVRTYRLCRRVLMFHHFPEESTEQDCLVRSTDFTYHESPVASFIRSITQSGYRRREDKTYQKKSLPSLAFTYSQVHIDETIRTIDPESVENLPYGVDGSHYQWVDLDGEGIAGILTEQAGIWFYKRNGGNGAFLPTETLLTQPSLANLSGGRQQLLDFSGDGRISLVQFAGPMPGFYERTTEDGWEPFNAFPSLPALNWSDPNLRFVDVTGDGLVDVLITDQDVFTWYPSRRKWGFGAGEYTPSSLDEERGPALVFADVDQSVHLADMSGDGLSDLVRIRNGEVCYWPNIGYGRFGAKVTLDNAPWFDTPDLFDQKRIRLADIDGSGTTDIIYLGRNDVKLFFNQSGNRLSDPHVLAEFPCVDNLSSVDVVDLLGNGTAYIIWSSPLPADARQPMHYIDLMGGQKPYLLLSATNNMGVETRVQYAASTKFYLADRASGTPWVTRLPFPVYVVERVETLDWVSNNRFVTRYAYHHGYYDGYEREFRGFGMVERQDAETLLADTQPTDVPPLLTRTWYHTGAWFQDGSFSQQYVHEYYQQDTQAYQLPDSVFDLTGGDPDLWREAYRSLKGQMLREEIYAPTAPTQVPEQDMLAPYSVVESNYHIRLLQPGGENKYGVYFVYPEETLTYDYERTPHDPRVEHTFLLQVDDYGNVLRSSSVAYGRRSTAQAILSEQSSVKITANIDGFINLTGAGVHLLGIPLENKEYEITSLSAKQGYLSLADLSAAIEQALTSSSARLLTWQRHFYWSADLKRDDVFGEVGPQALASHTEKAVLSVKQASQAFAGALSNSDLETLLTQQGGYQLDAAEAYWWNPGLREAYLDASQFFLPASTTDPYGNSTTYAYDASHLLPVQVTDALDNQIVVQSIDYQALAPQRLRDPNGNIAEVLFDPLGEVIVSSHYGTENGQPVGFMQLKEYQQQSLPTMDEVITHPQTYLQGASSYFYYNLSAWAEQQIPVHAVSLVPTNYPGSEASPIQISLSYSDGFGRTQQSSIKVETGEAYTIGPDAAVTSVVTSDRWLTSGRVVYNNKGAPVKQYEPFYMASYQYVDNPDLNTFGVSPTLFYDPLGRLIRTDTAKGFFTRTEFTPWSETYYDEDDTIKDSAYYKSNINNQSADFQYELQALQKATLFYNTPTVRVQNNLGRTILEIQQQGDAQLKTHYEWDIQGNQLASADPRLYAMGKENYRMSYAMTGEVLKTVSADAGTRWQLHNIMGNPIYARDARNIEVMTRHDALQRPIAIHIKGGDGAVPLDQITERIIYGDSLDENGKPFVTDPEKANQRGQLYRHYDQTGVLQSSAYSILGRPLQAGRQLRQDYKQEANWNDVSAETLAKLLQPTIYQETFQYDALGRIKAATNPDGNISEPTYHISGRLNQIQVLPQSGQQAEIYVQGIDYNAKGQRQSITYGNGVMTRYDYEPTTFRLTRILTTRSSDGKKLQDLTYTYDPVGNITHIVDGAQETVLNANQQVNPASDYTYDALYRLIAATGREHPALSPQDEQRGDFDASWILPLQPLNNGQALQNYSQQFTYDDGGNLYRIQHQGTTAWMRTLTVSDSSNRAVDSQLTDKPAGMNAYFDGNGNQTRMAGLQADTWNYRNNIASVTVIERQNAPSDGEYYGYDGAGNRVRKVSEQYGNGGAVAHIEETIYLGALEIKRIRRANNVVEERHSLRVMDDERAVATRVVWTQGTPPDGTKNPQVRYQLDDHLGSVALEVDAAGQMISYEEYFPYGGTALAAGRNASEVNLKQYRYSSKERDRVTGFYYYGIRYYVPWLGRWMSPDPAGTVDGLNLYIFVRGNPINFMDAKGNNGKAASASPLPLPDPINFMDTKGNNAGRKKGMKGVPAGSQPTRKPSLPLSGGRPVRSSRNLTINYTERGTHPFNLRAIYSATTLYPPLIATMIKDTLPASIASIARKLVRPTMSGMFDIELRAEYASSKFTRRWEDEGWSLSRASVSRDHRLADSSIQNILVSSLNQHQGTPAQEIALKKWFKSLGDPTSFDEFEKASNAFKRSDFNAARSSLQSAYKGASVNKTNVRPGEAITNGRLNSAFDPHYDPMTGFMTPRSQAIKEATLGLAAPGVDLILLEVAIAATTQAIDKSTLELLSSTK